MLKSKKRLHVAAVILLCVMLLASLLATSFVGSSKAYAEETVPVVEKPEVEEYIFLLDFTRIYLSKDLFISSDDSDSILTILDNRIMEECNGTINADFSEFFVEDAVFYLNPTLVIIDRTYSRRCAATLEYVTFSIHVVDVDNSFLDRVAKGHVQGILVDEVWDMEFTEVGQDDYTIAYKWSVYDLDWNYICTFDFNLSFCVYWQSYYNNWFQFTGAEFELDYSNFECYFDEDEVCAYNEYIDYVQSGLNLPEVKTYTVNVLNYTPNTLAPFVWTLEWTNGSAYLDLPASHYVEITPSSDSMSCTVTIKRKFNYHNIKLVCTGSDGETRAVCVLKCEN